MTAERGGGGGAGEPGIGEGFDRRGNVVLNWECCTCICVFKKGKNRLKSFVNLGGRNIGTGPLVSVAAAQRTTVPMLTGTDMVGERNSLAFASRV